MHVGETKVVYIFGVVEESGCARGACGALQDFGGISMVMGEPPESEGTPEVILGFPQFVWTSQGCAEPLRDLGTSEELGAFLGSVRDPRI